MRGPALVGPLCAAVTAYVSVRFLMKYFETNRLMPFAASAHHHVKHGIAALCLGLGAFVLAWFQTGPAGGASPRQGRAQ